MSVIRESNIGRRSLLKQISLLAMGGTIMPAIISSCKENIVNPTLLVVSGWQDVNIGDIAHSPGLLNVLETFWPEANIILWKRSKSEEVERMLQNEFPKLSIIHGNVDDNYQTQNIELLEAFEKSDIMIHGSGPSVVGRTNLQAWVEYADKPFGIFGTTIQIIDEGLKELLMKASFIYTRETASLEVLASEGLVGDHIDFVPDATFFLGIQAEGKANRFLEERGLEEKKFICAIPRLRYTPYHKIRKVDWSAEKIREVEETNEKFKEQDHAKLREAIVWWVRETGNYVLVCAEMTYQVDIMDELLIDPLPDDIKPKVMKRGYWFPDEAASVYAKAFAVLSFECHTPIISLRNGTPAFYLRQPEDTIKGQMYYDLGLDDWIFEIDETTGKDITRSLKEVYEKKENSKRTIRSLHKKLDGIYANATGKLKQLV